MIYLLSWHGRGFVAYLFILLPVLLGVLAEAVFEKYFVLAFGIGWLISGAFCWVLGRKWNAVENLHRFCGASLQAWGYIFGGIGLFLTWFGVVGARYGM